MVASKFKSDPEVGVRNSFAHQRTELANERTLLAYVRTALALIITGASSMHLPGLHPNPSFNEWPYYVVGAALLTAGMVIGLLGYRRYKRMKREIEEIL